MQASLPIAHIYCKNELPQLSKADPDTGFRVEYTHGRDLSGGERFARVLIIIATIVGSILCLGIPFAVGQVRDQFRSWCEEVKSGREVDLWKGYMVASLATSIKEKLNQWPDAINSVAGFMKAEIDEQEVRQKFIFRDADGSQWNKAELFRAIEQMAIQNFANTASATASFSVDMNVEFLVISKAPDGFRAISGSQTLSATPGSFSSGFSFQSAGVNIAAELNSLGFKQEDVIVNGEFA